MVKDNCIINRTRLVDIPIVEMLLAKKYAKSDVKFMRSDTQNDADCTDVICYSCGTQRRLTVKRNSSKYYDSPNFSLSVNKNKLNLYYGTSFVFIDEVSNCLYIIDGMTLLGYVLDHSDNVKQSDNNKNNYYLIIPKKDIASMIETCSGSVIKYGKSVAHLFSIGRDESQFVGLV